MAHTINVNKIREMVSFELGKEIESLCGSVVEHWSVESKGQRFNSSWGLRTFFFFPHL